jgi:murein DD-endopeptidase MepM/ murein hydrolase activator NlpD
VDKARDILDRFDAAEIFDSPYLASALYYHEGFLDDYPDARPDGNPARRIISRISRLLTPERRARYIEMLREAARREAAQSRYVVPVRYAEVRRRRRTHKFAVDLFAAEGSPVFSASPGVVVLAEGNWERGDPFSTSSQEGGNSVIVFDPENDRFLRYCHLGTTLVRPGEPVAAGSQIGTVGHTGANASRRGHGRHLHFEVNQWDGRRMRALTNAELQALVKRWRGARA